MQVMNKFSYEMTGFQSACSEYAEDRLSLDKYYLIGRPSIFIVQFQGIKSLGVEPGDKLIIDRSLKPKEGKLVLAVINNEFSLQRFSKRLCEGQDPETGDFIWGVVKAFIRDCP